MTFPPEFTEELALHKFASGDQSSAVCLYDRYSRIAYSLALRITGDVRSAEAVVVEAFIELARNAVDLAAKRASAILFLITKTRRLALRRIKNRDIEYCDFLEIETADYPECIIGLGSGNPKRVQHPFPYVC